MPGVAAGIKRAGLALLLLTADMAAAAAAEHGGEEVQGTAGWLNVSGTMHEATCQLEMSSRWQSITLPAVGTGELQRPGDSAEPTPFTLRLTGCMRSAGSVLNSQNNTLAWSAQQPIVTLTFTAPADAQTPALFQVKGAEGIGLRLRDAHGNTLRPGVPSAPWFLTPGDDQLRFTIAPERTAALLKADAYQATLDFQLYYQ
ncbi:S-fimbrial protein subunit SfaG precursor [Serratia quinivorans]|nr:S-fimbrial protein subunit SfaG precursor [Serratia quinivorans]CAI1713278.1 S-fimbrial protein subunit SfaG precursor [Serratia quinivorans]